MRKSILAFAVLAGVAAMPPAAHAQHRILVQDGVTTGLGDSGDVGIAAELQPRFREYIAQENVPNYTLPGPIEVGTILPEVGVTFYDVPQQYGANRYRYTRVNDRTILVEPRTRRIVQVID